MLRCAILLLVPFAAVGCTTPADDAAAPVTTRPSEGSPATATTQQAETNSPVAEDVAELARGYRQLSRMTAKPSEVSMSLMFDCRSPTAERTKSVHRKHGPHTNARLNVYMNELAAEAFGAKSSGYPVGSVVVKEKLDWVTDDDAAHEASGVAGMIKRPEGYDPGHGDWEYFYFEDASHIESGRLATCVQCHAGAAVTDHVYGDWAPGRRVGTQSR